MPRKRNVDKILDVRGLPCPTPTVIAGKTLMSLDKGKTLKIISNDMTTRETIPPLCSGQGCTLLETGEENGLLFYIIRK
jgi:TusA-related sulfurtransferase